MVTQVKTNKLVVVARPRFHIDGKPEPRLSTDLINLEATEDEYGITRLESVFLNWGRATDNSIPDYLYYDGAVLYFGKEIQVYAGEEDNSSLIFSGIITSIEGNFLELRPPEIKVRAEDKLQWLRMKKRSRSYENMDDNAMTSIIAGDYGLSANASTDAPDYEEYLQVNQSDLTFLRDSAKRVDARLDQKDNNLFFLPRRGSTEMPVKLTRKNELLRFQVNADLTHQRTEVRVHGYSVDGKRGIHETAGTDALSDEQTGSGRTGPDLLSNIQSDLTEDLHLETPATDAEANIIARSAMRKRARRFVVGNGVTNGTPGLHVGGRVDIVDIGSWFSGIHHIVKVRHCFDQRDGLRTYFTTERVEVGE